MKELLEKFGIEATEELTIEDAVSQITAKQRELFLSDATVIEPLKQNFTKEAQIVATKNAKKEANKTFDLGLTNKELDEIDYSALLDLGKKKLGTNTNVDEQVKKLQADLMSLANEKVEIETKLTKQLEETINGYKSKESQKAFENELLKGISGKTFIIPAEQVIQIIKMSIQSEGINPTITENGLEFIKDGYAALKADKTGKADLKYFIKKYADGFEKKSNGASGTTSTKLAADVKQSPQSLANIRKMEELIGSN